MASSGNSFWFMSFFALIPALLQLRFLRSLPISAARLAAVMVATAILPLAALCALLTGTAAVVLGFAPAAGILKSYAGILAPCSLCIYLFVRLGVGTLAYALMVLTTILFQAVPLWTYWFFEHRETHLGLTVGIVVVCILSGFLLTRRALMRSSRPYRVQANLFSNAAWSAGR